MKNEVKVGFYPTLTESLTLLNIRMSVIMNSAQPAHLT